MGYTHYWTQLRDFTRDEWERARGDIATILETAEHYHEIRLCNAAGERGTKPDLTAEEIMFNGSGEDAHETFYVSRKRPPLEEWQSPDRRGWNFCKTAQKPYDAVVCAVLCYLNGFHEFGEDPAKPVFQVSSDGCGADFQAGLAIAKNALPALGNQLDLPRGVMEDDRWCAPYLDLQTNAYQFRFCVDGHAYVMGKGETFRFHTHHLAALWASTCKEKAIVIDGWRGRTCEGGASLFEPSGCFNDERNRVLARQQSAALRGLLDNARIGLATRYGELGHEPPAFVRPGDVFAPLEEPNRYWMRDLLKIAAAA